jgi:hypothetical protein
MLVVIAALGLGAAMLVMIEAGRKLGKRQVDRHGTGARSGVGVVDSVVFSLLGLLIGFAFSGAAARFDSRRSLIVEQVGAISTAWMRLDLLQDDREDAARKAFRHYMDALLQSYAHAPGTPGALRAIQDAEGAQNEIWRGSVAASLSPGGDPARIALLPALNEMFDAVETERLTAMIHPPLLIYFMIGGTALAAALFAGYAMASGQTRNWLHSIGAAVTIALAVFVILELESPRLGLIRVDAIDRALVETRAMMD